MKKFFKSIIILPLFLFSTCLNERIDEPACLSCADDEIEITLNLDIPYATPKTGISRHAIGETQENLIETLDVLAFRVEGSSQTFLYRTQAFRTSGNTTNSEQKFRTRIRVTDNPNQKRLVIISNARTQIDELFNSIADPTGQEKEALLSRLVVELDYDAATDTYNRWNVTNSTNFDRFPMWGEVSAATAGNPVKMLRMTAKIEVDIHPDVRARFKLKSVHVFNSNYAGRIVPNAANINAGMAAERATLPTGSNPADPHEFRVSAPMDYDDFNSPGTPDIAMRGAIYMFETKAMNEGERLDETYIVIGGEFDNSPISYYRIDFFNINASNGDITHLDILRNHSYVVTITGVSDVGYSNPGEAAQGISYSDIVAEVKPYNDGEIRNFVFNNHHSLGVSSKEIEILGAVTANDIYTLKVFTDVPAGWDAVVLNGDGEPLENNWLQLDVREGNANQTTDVRLIVQPNPHLLERTAYIHIVAGWLHIPVKVVQGSREETITVSTPEEIHFSGEPSVAITVTPLEQDGATVYTGGRWTLVSNAPWLKLSFDNNAATATTSIDFEGGERTVYLFAEFNSGAVREASITATLNKEGRDIASATENVRQRSDPSQNIVVTTDDNDFLLDGEEVTIHVDFNPAWKVKSVTQETTDYFGIKRNDGILSAEEVSKLMTVTGSYATSVPPKGTPVTFKVEKDRTKWGLLKITFEREEGGDETTLTMMFALPHVTVLGISSNTIATDYGHNPAHPSTANDANAMLRAPVNFGLDETSTVYSRGFTFRSIRLNPTYAALQTELNRNPDIVVLVYDLLIPSTPANNNQVQLYVDYVNRGGVLLVFSENQRARALIQHNSILGSSALLTGGRLAGSIYQIFAESNTTYQLNDPISNGPFGDIRGSHWGEDASTTDNVTIPTNQLHRVVRYSNGYNHSAQAGNTDRYSAFRLIRPVGTQPGEFGGFVYFGDAGYLSSRDRISLTICPFQINTTTKAPITKNYGNTVRRFPVYNSHLFGNMMTWAITQTTVNYKY